MTKKNEFDIKELHKVQLSLLKELDRVCRENSIRYFLAQGTLIGAIRHKGFIPWDDDIDVILPLKDYMKLKRFGQQIWSRNVFLQYQESDKQYNKCYMRLRRSDTTLIIDNDQDQDINHGIAVDIYPLISLSDNKFRRIKQYADTMLYMLLQENHIPKNHSIIFKVGAAIILPLISKRRSLEMKRKLFHKITHYTNSKTKNCYIIDGSLKSMKQMLYTYDFSKNILVPFEDTFFSAPVGYDRYLRERYGDYMKLPPIEQQGIKLEHFVKIDTNTPYKKFKGIYYCRKKG